MVTLEFENGGRLNTNQSKTPVCIANNREAPLGSQLTNMPPCRILLMDNDRASAYLFGILLSCMSPRSAIIYILDL